MPSFAFMFMVLLSLAAGEPSRAAQPDRRSDLRVGQLIGEITTATEEQRRKWIECIEGEGLDGASYRALALETCRSMNRDESPNWQLLKLIMHFEVRDGLATVMRDAALSPDEEGLRGFDKRSTAARLWLNDDKDCQIELRLLITRCKVASSVHWAIGLHAVMGTPTSSADFAQLFFCAFRQDWGLNNPNPSAPVLAAIAKRHKIDLKPLVSSELTRWTMQVIGCLGNEHGRPYLAILEARVDDDNPDVAREALIALARVDPRGDPTIRALKAAEADARPERRRAAEIARLVIRESEAGPKSR